MSYGPGDPYDLPLDPPHHRTPRCSQCGAAATTYAMEPVADDLLCLSCAERLADSMWDDLDIMDKLEKLRIETYVED